MDGSQRRDKINKYLTSTDEPITGTKLAKLFSVSRQVIVQDIALLRAKGTKIISTTNGYIISGEKEGFTKLLAVKHTKEQIREELETIIDYGATVVNVMVIHPVYGEITADLMLSSRQHINDFINKIDQHSCTPLMTLKSGEHYHLIKASSPKILKLIEEELREKGYLI